MDTVTVDTLAFDAPAFDAPVLDAPAPEVHAPGTEDSDPILWDDDEDLGSWISQGTEARSPFRAPRRGARRRRAVALLVVAVVVAGVGYLLWQLRSDNNQIAGFKATDAQRAVVLSTAKTASVDMTTYNYKNLAVFFSTIEGVSTPNYIAVVEKDKPLLTEAFTQGHASSTASVVGSGISSMTATKAVVVLFVDQTVTNTLTKAPTKDLSRVELTLDRQHGKWLVDQVQLP